jgi:hypothetical protein
MEKLKNKKLLPHLLKKKKGNISCLKNNDKKANALFLLYSKKGRGEAIHGTKVHIEVERKTN